MAKPLTDTVMQAFRESIRNVAIEFKMSNITIVGMLEIIQTEISREEMIRQLACVPEWEPDDDGELAEGSKCGETDSIDVIGMPQE